MDLQTQPGPGGPLAVVQQQPSLEGRRQRSDYYERELQHILSLEQIKAIRSSNEYTEGPSVAARRAPGPRTATTNPRDKQERTHEVILVNVNNNYEPGNPLNALNSLPILHSHHSQHSQPGLSRSTSSGSASSGSSGSSEQGLLAGGRPPHHRNHNNHHGGPTAPQPPNQHNHHNQQQHQHNRHNQQQNNRNQKYRNVPIRTQPQPKAISQTLQYPVGDLVKTPGNGKSLETPGMPLGAVGHQFICERCGKCKCAECTAPRSLPACLACGGQCLCSAQSALEHGTCMCLVKGLFYHCSGEDHDDQGDSCADQPCSLSRAHCCSRFLCMGLMAVLFPCLLCYPPVKACLRAAQGLYDRALRPGCRCKNSNTVYCKLESWAPPQSQGKPS